MATPQPTATSAAPSLSTGMKIGVGVTIVGVSALAYYLWRQRTNQISSNESTAHAKPQAATPTAAAPELSRLEQMRVLIARSLDTIQLIRSIYRGASSGGGDVPPSPAAAAATGESGGAAAKNGRIRLRLLLDGLTQLQHPLLAVQNFTNFYRSATAAATAGSDEPAWLDASATTAVSRALSDVSAAIDAAVPDAKRCQSATKSEWLLSGGAVRVRLYVHGDTIYRAHSTLFRAIDGWKAYLLSPAVAGSIDAGDESLAGAIRALTTVRPEPPRALQDLTREEEEVEDLYLLRGLSDSELKQTVNTAFAGAPAEVVISSAARRLDVFQSLDAELSVLELLQFRISLLNTAVQVFQELDRTSSSGDTAAAGTEFGEDLIETLFRAEQERLSLQTRITGLNHSVRGLNLKLSSHHQTKSQLDAIATGRPATGSVTSSDSVNANRMAIAANEDRIEILTADRARVESERAKLLVKLDSAKRKCILLKAYKNLPALFHSLNVNIPPQLTALQNGKLTQTLKTISQWSLCLQPSALPSASDLFLMKHQMGEGMTAMTDTRAAIIERVRRIANAHLKSITASASNAAVSIPMSRADVKSNRSSNSSSSSSSSGSSSSNGSSASSTQSWMESSDADVLHAVLRNCTLPDAKDSSAAAGGARTYAAGTVRTGGVADEAEDRYTATASQVRDQLACSKSIHNTLKALHRAVSSGSKPGTAAVAAAVAPSPKSATASSTLPAPNSLPSLPPGAVVTASGTLVL